jgi:hypothetical protein
MKTIKQKNAQAWGMDLMVGLMLFSFGIATFYLYSINNQGESRENFERINYDGNKIMNSILSEGYPLEWNTSNFIKIGILSGDKVNQTKLENFYNLTQNNYSITKAVFSTKYDYYFITDNITYGTKAIEGIGKPGSTIATIPPEAKNLVKINRFIIYKEKPVSAYLYIWE